MHDLVLWVQCQIKEAWKRYRRDVVGQAQHSACVVCLLGRIARDVELFFRSNDVDFLTVVERLADEGHVLKTEKGNVSPKDFVCAS